MWLWPVRTGRERALDMALFAIVVAVAVMTLLQFVFQTPLGRLLSLPIVQLNAADGEPDGVFTLAAPDGDDLYPGAAREFAVTLTNPFPFAIDITKIWASLDSTSSRRCAASPTNLQIGEYHGAPLPVRLPADDSRRAGVVPVAMPRTVDQACAGVSFQISLHGTAMKAQAA